jgi:DNA-binding protein H-NS
MAKSYIQLQTQIETLQRQAEQLKAKEIDGVVSRIKVAIAHYGLTAEQLGLGASTRRGRAAGKKRASGAAGVAKYADGQGRSWSGRGPRPAWLREALAAGKSLQDFDASQADSASGAVAASVAKARTKVVKPKRKTGIRFKDQAGNSWSGMGPKPRWFKEAIASGLTPEQLAA